MKVFSFNIQETLSRTIEVEADSEEIALQMVKSMYRNEDVVLDYSDHEDTRIVLTADCEEIENDQAIIDVIRYLYDDEKKHFEENGKHEKDHIFLKLEQLRIDYDLVL